MTRLNRSGEETLDREEIVEQEVPFSTDLKETPLKSFSSAG